MNKIRILTLSVTLAILAGTTAIESCSGRNSSGIDTSFGTNGRVATDFNGQNDDAYAVAVQSDGKIIAAGRTYLNSQYDIALARYLSNGTIDTTFGTSGKVSTDINGSNDQANAVAVQSDGKIVVGGSTGPTNATNALLVRYDSFGALDSSFNGSGKLSIATGSQDEIRSVVIQADGLILASGFTKQGTVFRFVIYRFLGNGTADTTFGSGGRTITSFGLVGDQAYAMSVGTDGKPVVAGQSQTAADASSFALARYTRTGALDTTFGTGGKVTFSIGEPNGFSAGGTALDIATGVGFSTGGGILVSGTNTTRDSGTRFAVVRYLPVGNVDATFGTNGKTLLTFYDGSSVPQAEDAQANGMIIDGRQGALMLGKVNATTSDFGLGRVDNSGKADNFLGPKGTLAIDFSSNQDEAFGGALQGDGKTVIVGHTFNNNQWDFALTRITP